MLHQRPRGSGVGSYFIASRTLYTKDLVCDFALTRFVTVAFGAFDTRFLRIDYYGDDVRNKL